MTLPARLSVCAAALMVLAALDGGSAYAASGDGTAPAASSSYAAKPRLIVYAGGESPGVQVHNRHQARRLRGAPVSFKRFIGRTAQRLTDHSTCQHAYVGVTVETLRTDGFAAGGVNDCGGYAALWAIVDGHWKQIQGTQDVWECRVLRRYRVPSDVAGNKCYNYKTQKSHHYHQA